MTSAPVVIRDDVDEHIRILTINRPDVRNACSREVGEFLDQELTQAECDDVRCVILTGSGDVAFSAGNDTRELQQLAADELRDLNRVREQWTWHWATTPLITVAALNGLAYGNGAILAMASDLRVGAAECSIKVTATGFGGANDTWILPALVGWSHAKDILLTGRVVGADELYRMGFLNRLADGDLLAEALALAREIASNPPSGPRDAKRLIHQAVGSSLATRFRNEALLQSQRLETTSMSALFNRSDATQPR